MKGSMRATERAERVELGRLASRARRPFQGIVNFIRRKPLGAFGGALTLFLVAVALLAPLLSPYDPNELFSEERLQAPSARHILGTDHFGRDVLSRVIWGARVSLYVGIGAVGLGVTAATVIGTTTGYFGGKIDIVIQRLVDAFMCFPWLILMLTLMVLLGVGLTNVAIALGITMTAGNSRVVRSAVLAIKENQYIEAAKVIGCPHWRIVLFYILPNVFAPIIVIATIGLGAAILAESSLSFLGFGVPPPWPSWGGMVSGPGREFLTKAPWIATFPGIAISLSVFGFNMLGDALRDVLDPRLRGS